MEDFGIALTPSTGTATATVPTSPHRRNGRYERYSDDIEEERGLLEGEDYNSPGTVRVAPSIGCPNSQDIDSLQGNHRKLLLLIIRTSHERYPSILQVSIQNLNYSLIRLT